MPIEGLDLQDEEEWGELMEQLISILQNEHEVSKTIQVKSLLTIDLHDRLVEFL